MISPSREFCNAQETALEHTVFADKMKYSLEGQALIEGDSVNQKGKTSFHPNNLRISLVVLQPEGPGFMYVAWQSNQSAGTKKWKVMIPLFYVSLNKDFNGYVLPKRKQSQAPWQMFKQRRSLVSIVVLYLSETLQQKFASSRAWPPWHNKAGRLINLRFGCTFLSSLVHYAQCVNNALHFSPQVSWVIL